uniref:Putative kazal domain protein n=1 Tax=Rhipicephalus microplus TaxID=6941 RepID=A0A6M2CUM4_RHIMP
MNFTVCFIALTFFLMSSDWQPSSNPTVQAGKVLFGHKGCWGHICYYGSCPKEAPSACGCPSPWEAIFGIKNCR